jgi:hypothetical protein
MDDTNTASGAGDTWVAQHLKELSKKYPGKYIGIVDNEVVAADDDLEKVYQKVNKEYPEKTPKISYIPKEDELKLL